MKLFPKIQLLDSLTINQIAAGEVIENSPSIVKELIENALDAQADHIVIETLGGGQGLIVVKDNGIGMQREDINNALMRHATSKIQAFDDLFTLNSYGFRGEALPSIASISKMQIHTCRENNGSGVLVNIEGGKIIAMENKSRYQGTTVAVESLFYNVPVRKHFQKTPVSDRLAIRKLLENAVLSTDNRVAWDWISERKEELRIQKEQSFQDRIHFVMGDAFMDEAIFVEESVEDIRVVAAFGSPAFHRPTRQGQRIFINDRPVESANLAKMILTAYGTLLPSQRYPVFIVKLYLPPSWCDVNVHPQKMEVRILKEDRVGSVLTNVITKTVSNNMKTVFCCPPRMMKDSVSYDGWSLEDLVKKDFHHHNQDTTLMTASTWNVSLEDQVFDSSNMLQEGSQNPQNNIKNPNVANAEHGLLPLRYKVRILKKLEQVILVEDEEGLYWIHSTNARKHLFYNGLIETNSKMESQKFLIPITFNVTKEESVFIANHIADFASLGVDISQVSTNGFIVESGPLFISDTELLDWLLFIISDNKFTTDHSLQDNFKSILPITKIKFQISGKHFSSDWIEHLWEIGKPELAFDGSIIRKNILEEELLKGWNGKVRWNG